MALPMRLNRNCRTEFPFLSPERKSSHGVLSSRLFFEMSPSMEASKGFLIVGEKGYDPPQIFNSNTTCGEGLK